MPLVLSKSKSMFLHLPKTGGTWVRFALVKVGIAYKDYELEHATYEESKHLFPDSPRFTILRNPFDWYASFWAMRQIEDSWGGAWVIGHDCKSNNFNKFIGFCCLKHPGFLTNVYKEFAVEGVTVLRTENLNTDLADYLESVDEKFDRDKLCSIEKVHRGASLEKYKTSVVYTEETRNLLADSEKELLTGGFVQ